MSLRKGISGDSKQSESEGETRMSVNPSVDQSLLSNYKFNHSQKQKRMRVNRQMSPFEKIEGLKWTAPRLEDPNRHLRSISQNRDAYIQNNRGGFINQSSLDAQYQSLLSQEKFQNYNDYLTEAKHSYQQMSFGEAPILQGKNTDLEEQKQSSIQQEDIQKNNNNETKQKVSEMIRLRRQQFNDLASMNEEEAMTFFRSYVVHNQENTPIQQIIASIHMKIEITNQFIYFGEVINRQHIGKGIMLYPNGRVYEGEWQNDCKFGKGYELFPNGNEYEGYYVNGKSEGVGTYTWANKEVYQGQWLGGFKHGSGIWRGTKGDSYIGEWNRGKADGYGVHTWQNGDRYEGEFRGCLKHGNGNEKFSNGDSYSGMYVNGRPDGQGQYYWSNGSSYVGEFKNGLRHGKGLWRKDNMVGNQSEQYEGEYQNDKKCGKGVFIWKSGNQYCGNFFDDLRDGYGEMHWRDGTTYKGNWSKGVQQGEGELSSPGQPVLKGIFKGTEFQGNPNSLQTQYKDQLVLKDTLDMLNENRSNRQQLSNKRHQKFQFQPPSSQGKHKADKMLYVPQILQYSLWKGQSKAESSQPQYPPSNSIIQDSLIYPQRQERNATFLNNQISSREEEQLAILSDLTNTTYLNQENDLSYELKSSSKNSNNRFLRTNLNNQPQIIPNNISTISTISPLNQFKLSPIRLKTEQSSPKSQIFPYTSSSKSKSKSQKSNVRIIRNHSPLEQQPSSFVCKTSNSDYKIPNPSKLSNLRSITPSASMHNNSNNKKKSGHKTILPSLVSAQKIHSSLSPQNSNKEKSKKVLLKKHEILVWKSLRTKLYIPNNALTNLKDKQTIEKIREILHPPLWKPAGLHQVSMSPEKENKSRSGSR